MEKRSRPPRRRSSSGSARAGRARRDEGAGRFVEAMDVVRVQAPGGAVGVHDAPALAHHRLHRRPRSRVVAVAAAAAVAAALAAAEKGAGRRGVLFQVLDSHGAVGPAGRLEDLGEASAWRGGRLRRRQRARVLLPVVPPEACRSVPGRRGRKRRIANGSGVDERRLRDHALHRPARAVICRHSDAAEAVDGTRDAEEAARGFVLMS